MVLQAGPALLLSALMTQRASFPSKKLHIRDFLQTSKQWRLQQTSHVGVLGVDERELDPLLSILAAAGGNESQQPGGPVCEITLMTGTWTRSRLLDQHLSLYKEAKR